MMPWDNQNTKTEQESIATNLQAGIYDGDAMDAGYEDVMAWRGYPLPAWAYKPLYMMTPYEQGMALGVLLKRWLKTEEIE